VLHAPDNHHNSPLTSPRSVGYRICIQTSVGMTSYDPPPPYDPPSAQRGTKQPRPAASITTLPLHLLHRIISLTLDPNATPSRFSGDFEEEKVRRMWALFLGLRGVDRRFFLGELGYPTCPAHRH
jgi:hypothetical protein